MSMWKRRLAKERNKKTDMGAEKAVHSIYH